MVWLTGMTRGPQIVITMYMAGMVERMAATEVRETVRLAGTEAAGMAEPQTVPEMVTQLMEEAQRFMAPVAAAAVLGARLNGLAPLPAVVRVIKE